MEPLTEELQRFVNESPKSRAPHIAFLQKAAVELQPGESVLDVGAGNSPYRELFAHVTFRTCDWAESAYSPEHPTDIIAPAHNIPLGDGELDGILNTQVLEHVPEPLLVLREFFRLLRPGGHLWITAPLVWYLHEQPHDYYRYTSHGLQYLLDQAGFEEIEIHPLNDSFSTLSQLVDDLGWMIGRGGDGYDDQRDLIARTMRQLASLIGSFSDFDTQWILPLNYSAEAVHPA